MRVIFDLTDLVEFVRHRRTLSGIQRVQVDSYLQLRKRPDLDVVPVYFSELSQRYFTVDVDRLFSFDRRYAKKLRRTSRSRFQKLVHRIYRLWSLQIKPNDLVFVAGAGWASRKRTRYLSVIQEKFGIHIGWMFFDLIPLSHPEYATDGNIREFQIWIDAALSLKGIFLCISEFSRNELLEYAGSKGLSANAVAVPLAHELSTTQSRIRGDYLYLKNERFVLCVGTLEGRKNHLALVRIWERIYRELGNDTPLLVLVGVKGWLVDRLNKFLRGTHFVYGQVVHLQDADDAELAWLYQHCEFTVFPSAFEGWGLPVGESLWFGKPCICYRHSSLPEVGGEHVIYCDFPNNAQLEQAIRQAIDGKFAATPPPRSQLRTWDAVATDIADALMTSVIKEKAHSKEWKIRHPICSSAR